MHLLIKRCRYFKKCCSQNRWRWEIGPYLSRLVDIRTNFFGIHKNEISNVLTNINDYLPKLCLESLPIMVHSRRYILERKVSGQTSTTWAGWGPRKTRPGILLAGTIGFRFGLPTVWGCLCLEGQSFLIWPACPQNQQYRVLFTSTSANPAVVTGAFRDLLEFTSIDMLALNPHRYAS